MASVLSHPAVPLAIACWAPSLRRPSLLIAGALLSAAPDLDVIGFWRGVPYESWCGHRGFTHSIAFALLVALLLGPWLARRCSVPVRRVVLFLWAAMASHGLVDMATNGGHGIALFWPFSTARLFWPWDPIEVATLSVGAFFSERGLVVLQSELLWLWLPAALIGGVGLWRTRRGIAGQAVTSIKVGGEGWSAQLPAGWRAADPTKGYVEAPDGTAGAYFLHVVIRGNDLVASMQRTRSSESSNLPNDGNGWQVVRQGDATGGPEVDISTDYYNAHARYLICCRMLGRGRRFVRMTFHDYDCEDPPRSAHRPHRWLASLTLHDDAG